MKMLTVAALGLAACLDLFTPVQRTVGAAVTVPVQVSVQGMNGAQTIGTIVADGGFKGNGTVGSGLRADFTFANNFGFLNNRYDFDWVNVATKQEYGASGPTALFPNPPNIDPIPQEDDNLPFYYNSQEWKNNEFVEGFPIHAERQYSRFYDFPNQPADRKFFFLTFLVLRDKGAYTLDGATKFCVLAGFSWQYQGAAGTPDKQRGTSTAVGPVSINQDVIDILTTSMNSGGAKLDDLTVSDKFTGWSAQNGCVLVPEPSTTSLACIACLALLARRRDHARMRTRRAGTDQSR